MYLQKEHNHAIYQKYLEKCKIITGKMNAHPTGFIQTYLHNANMIHTENIQVSHRFEK